MPGPPFRTFAAIPVPDADNAVAQAYGLLSPIFYLADGNAELMAPIVPVQTNNVIRLTGLPFAGVVFRPIKEASGQFLLGEAFPNTPRSSPLPPELFNRLATKNLVYYHFEVTADRIPQLLQMSQLGLTVTRHKQLDAASASYKWMQRIGALFTYTDTEITESGQAELTFARKTPGIFTAAELFAVANWLEAKDFPGCDIKLPPPSERYKQAQQRKFHLLGPTGH